MRKFRLKDLKLSEMKEINKGFQDIFEMLKFGIEYEGEEFKSQDYIRLYITDKTRDSIILDIRFLEEI